MSTAAQVVKEAKSHLGYQEKPPGSNRTKFGIWYGIQGVPWCAQFVSYCLFKAGIDGIKFAYTPYGVQFFKDNGWWHDGINGIQSGDVVFFDFPDSTFRVQHVGFATGKAKEGYVPTIEGNTSQSSDDNGGEVQARSRPRSYIVGYGRPPYRTDKDYIVKVEGRIHKFERFHMAMQKIQSALSKGKKVKAREVKG